MKCIVFLLFMFIPCAAMPAQSDGGAAAGESDDLQRLKAADIKSKKMPLPVASNIKEEAASPLRPGNRVEASRMKKLLRLARYVYNNKESRYGGLCKGLIFEKHCFKIEYELASDSLGLESISFTRGGNILHRGIQNVIYENKNKIEWSKISFSIDPAGVVYPWIRGLSEKDLKAKEAMLKAEVDLWVEYEIKREGELSDEARMAEENMPPVRHYVPPPYKDRGSDDSLIWRKQHLAPPYTPHGGDD